MSERMTAIEIAVATLGATLGTKLDNLTAAVNAQHTDHEARMRVVETRPAVDPTHEERISKLERAWWMLTGAAMVAGGGAGGIITAIWG
ncbi:hypothetical protein [Pseudonocardia broussonetiae]|uniref:Uncharacterized protein n=1 Tax=Pseudonocardia broussonetiae TaxID=2736640 RepID=A0A6M6JV05_9PSEU|nr:hypothetical protein [Pseudonocardia broussonetiae]QJY51245.1 hypothetical protein HOP40_35275 [Pseudonocardia broussonetiae]